MELYVLIGLSYAMADCKMYISNNYSNCGQRYGPVGLVWTPINTNISISAVKRSIGSTTGCTITVKAPTRGRAGWLA